MKIDYVVISSDDSHYLDFYEPVAQTWKKLGFKTILLHITEEDRAEETEYGIYQKVKRVGKYPTGWQAQLVRLYARKMFPNSNLLLSDIDMVPLSAEYFVSNASSILDEQILAYSGQPYGNVPYYPICYILGAGKQLEAALNLPNTFEAFLRKVSQDYTVKWNSDEHYLYDHLKGRENLSVLPVRDYSSDRVDRSNWNYNPKKLTLGKYIDSHLLRPFKQHSEEIQKMLELVSAQKKEGKQ